jgi:hypothetical protein
MFFSCDMYPRQVQRELRTSEDLDGSAIYACFATAYGFPKKGREPPHFVLVLCYTKVADVGTS